MVTEVSFFRVYVPERVNPIIQHLYDSQAGKYIVTVPCFPGSDERSGEDGASYICQAVMDDFGSLRRVQ